MYRKLYAVLMSLFLTMTVLPQGVYAEEGPAQTEGEITETEGTVQEEAGEETEEPVEISGPSAEEEQVSVESEQSNDELLQQYFDRSLFASGGRKRAAASSSLQGNDAIAYSVLKGMIQDVAAGRRASTAFTITAADLGLDGQMWTAEELGVSAIVEDGAISDEASDAARAKAAISYKLVIKTLLSDLPYDLYWFDKTIGYRYGSFGTMAAMQNGVWKIYLDGEASFELTVAQEYRDSGNLYMTDLSVISSINNAVTNAQNIAASHASETDYQKLDSFRQEICSLVAYNHAAADDDNTPYGNPWQLIWVFDGDSSTDVVCEGYSKAFKYLCDLSQFSHDISCITVTGIMAGGTGEGRHMWNVVTMENHKNYLTDITNCDSGSIGEGTGLFMIGAVQLDAGAYRAVIDAGTGSERTVDYTYDEDTHMLWDAYGCLEISDTDYLDEPVSVPVSGVSLDQDAITLTKGQTQQLQASVSPEDAANKNITWTSDHPQTASVSQDGTVTAVETGTAVITVTTEDGGYTAQCTVTVINAPVHVTGITLNRTSMTLQQGETADLVASIEPSDADNQEVIFTSSDETVASVSPDGIVTALDEGSAEITAASAEDPGIRAVCTVTVNSPAPHVHTEMIDSAVPATCTESGLTEGKHCSECGEILVPQETVPALGHDYRESVTAPTCSEGGYTTYTCTRCGDTYIDSHTEALGHAWDEGTVTLEPTCTETGIRTYTCQNDPSHTRTEEIPAAGHTPAAAVRENEVPATCSAEGSYDEVIYCSVCHEELDRTAKTSAKLSHTEETIDGIPATCTETGLSDGRRCTVCGEILVPQETVPALGHDYRESVTAPTCSEGGYTTYTCTRCGDTYIDSHTEALGHAWDEGTVTLEPTCTEAGIRTYTCQNDPSHTRTEGIPAYGHTPAAAVRENEIAPTYEAEGSYDEVVYCSVCGEKLSRITRTIDKLLPGVDYEYTSSDSGVTITKYIGTAAEVTIPSEIGGLPVTAIGPSAFSERSDLTSVTIPDSVTEIGDSAFRYCRGLTHVVIPASVSTIGNNVFEGNGILKTAGPLGSGTDIEFGWTTEIPAKAFTSFAGLTSVTIPEGITSIGNDAFRYCSHIHSILLPESLTRIGNTAFQRTGLSSITIPASVTSIGSYVFSGCDELKTAGPAGSGSDIEFCWTTSIPGNAFSGDTGLTAITIPDSVTEIGMQAFVNCSGLTDITLPADLPVIRDGTFMYCKSLENITLPEGLTEIEQFAFYGCTGLQSITIPDGVTHISAQVFYQCSSLAKVILPASVTELGHSMFKECPELKTAGPIGSGADLEYGWTESIPENAFNGCGSLLEISLPDTLTYIGTKAFSRCSGLTGITLPESLDRVEYRAFAGCDSLMGVTIPAGVTLIRDYAFGYTDQDEPVEGFTITGYKNTKAEAYANANHFAFVDLSRLFTEGAVADIEPLTYTGTAIEPALTVTVGGAILTAGTDYTVSYADNINAGTASATVTGIGDYTGTVVKEFRIVPKEIVPSVTLTGDTYTYNGSAQQPDVTVSDGDTALVKDKDYTVAYENNTNAGTANVTVTCKGNYTGTVTKDFAINAKAITPSVTLTASAYAYDGKAKTPGVTVKDGELTLTKGTDYTVSYAAGRVNAGTYTVKVTLKGNYSGTASKSFTIKPKAITPAVTLTTTAYTYDGKAKTPGVTVKDETTALTKGTDYTVTYASGRVNAGTYTVKVTLKGNYSGTKTVSFRINKAAQAVTAKAAAASAAVGKTTTVSVTGNQGTVSYKSSDTTIATVSAGKVTAKKVGTVKITATAAATANYNAASKTVTIKIVPAATASVTAENLATGMKVTWKKVTGATGYYVYRNGTQIKKITSGSTVTYTDTKANTNGTKYTYKIVAYAATGKSTLSKSVTSYKVAQPKISSLTNSAAGKLTVKWAKNAKATGYEIQYSTSSKFTKSTTKTVTVTKYATVSRVIASLTKGKTYYVRMRTYKTVSSKKYYSVWSAVKKLKLTK